MDDATRRELERIRDLVPAEERAGLKISDQLVPQPIPRSELATYKPSTLVETARASFGIMVPLEPGAEYEVICRLWTTLRDPRRPQTADSAIVRMTGDSLADVLGKLVAPVRARPSMDLPRADMVGARIVGETTSDTLKAYQQWLDDRVLVPADPGELCQCGRAGAARINPAIVRRTADVPTVRTPALCAQDALTMINLARH